MKQKDAAAHAGVDQASLSRAERGSTRVVQSAINVLDQVFEYEIGSMPHYAIKRFPSQKLAGGKTFENLNYHLKVLYFIHWCGLGCHFTDVLNEFPGFPDEEPQYLETDSFRLRIGGLDPGAASALNDLLQDGLVKVDNFSARSLKSEKERHRRFLSRGNYSQKQIDYAVNESRRQSLVGYQDEGCWYADEDERLNLDDSEVWFTLVETDKGAQIWKLFPSLEGRLRKESLDLHP